MAGMIDTLVELWAALPGELQFTVLTVLKIVVVLVPLILCVAYLTLAERKIIGYMQNRIGHSIFRVSTYN